MKSYVLENVTGFPVIYTETYLRLILRCLGKTNDDIDQILVNLPPCFIDSPTNPTPNEGDEG